MVKKRKPSNVSIAETTTVQMKFPMKLVELSVLIN